MDRNLLEISLVIVDPPDDGLTRRVYELLFERYPQTRPLFSADIRPQARMLRQALMAVVDHLDDAAWLEAALAVLGQRHAEAGVTPEMYPWVAECITAAMEEIGGAGWTRAMTAAWTEALGEISAMMLAGERARA